MEFWLDSASVSAVKKIRQLGILFGVTTNPSLLHSHEQLKELLEAFEGPLAVQVRADNAASMIEQGKMLSEISDRIIVKVPVTREGLETIHHLYVDHVVTMATCVFTPAQALLASEAGADYVALYLGRLKASGGSLEELLASCRKIFLNYHRETRILAASIQDLKQIQLCAETGIEAVTLKETLFEKLLLDNPLTLEAIQEFDMKSKAEDASLYKPRSIV